MHDSQWVDVAIHDAKEIIEKENPYEMALLEKIYDAGIGMAEDICEDDRQNMVEPWSSLSPILKSLDVVGYVLRFGKVDRYSKFRIRLEIAYSLMNIDPQAVEVNAVGGRARDEAL